jgi:hypothetical protein
VSQSIRFRAESLAAASAIIILLKRREKLSKEKKKYEIEKGLMGN